MPFRDAALTGRKVNSCHYMTLWTGFINNLPFKTLSELKYLGVTVPRKYKKLH